MSRPNTSAFDVGRILTETSVQHVEYYPRLESTSSTAAEFLSPLLERSPAIVLTSEQTAGRGRKGNLWWSSTGALTFSLVVDAAEILLSAERRPLISLAAGLAMRDSLTHFMPDRKFDLKWPNDVLT
jgi:BirA family biotin operon repressor/biotin-[acetyl-CoA-carboxylase] ligase